MSEFTKMWRVKHDEPLNYNERIINSACDIIEKQVEELDAECRISQMLLANKKKQAKRIKELEDLLCELYDEAAYEDAGKWVLENKDLQKRIDQALKPRT